MFVPRELNHLQYLPTRCTEKVYQARVSSAHKHEYSISTNIAAEQNSGSSVLKSEIESQMKQKEL